VPIYDYACGACGRVTEVIHGINDSGPRFCPECGAEGSMRKALSTPAIVFKGSGWARVDRRSSSGSSSGSGTKGRGGAKPAATATEGESTGSAAGATGPAEATASGTSSPSGGGKD
jgi:putative FmdB family regulatory protein